jgi:glycerol-1-phosphate dehydrogenase [NAD(P)+]
LDGRHPALSASLSPAGLLPYSKNAGGAILARHAARHLIDLPRTILVGSGIRFEVPQRLRDLSVGRRILIVSGSGDTRFYAKELCDILSDKGFEVSRIEVSSSTIESVEKVIEASREYGSEVFIGLGGGKAIDVAKYAAKKAGRIFISFPTAPSHDGIASPFASIKGIGEVRSVEAVTPMAIFVDIDYMIRSPKRLLLAGVGDLIAKFTATLDWRLAHMLHNEYYAEYAASLALHSAKHVIRSWRRIKRCTQDSLRVIVEGLISSGVAMCIAGSTRPASGSEHLFSHALDLVAGYPALHGEQVGVGTIMMLRLHGKNWRRIRYILRRLGAPTTARELGVSREKVIEALTIAHKIRPERYTILGRDGLTPEAAENLAVETGVIE